MSRLWISPCGKVVVLQMDEYGFVAAIGLHNPSGLIS